ncbi:MAG TPA: uracil-DNA glycosylase [Thermoanaerobaculia bacterium]
MNDALLRELALLRDLGYTHLDLTTPPAQTPEPAVAPPQGDTELNVLQEFVPPPPRDEIAAAQSLDELRPIALPCTRCRLATTRTQVVFGVGNPNADLMFIGEAPGRDEDQQGEPFVGRAGQLLSDIIKAMKLTRDDVYIANVIKCRPPENRNPEPDELDACRPYIRKQVELIQPKVIVTLGRFGLQSLLEKSYGISSVRGSWLEYNGIKVMPTYHPAYLLRTPAAKKDVWADMKKVMGELGITF